MRVYPPKNEERMVLDFMFDEKVALTDTEIHNQVIVAIDLGINSTAIVFCIWTALAKSMVPKSRDSICGATSMSRTWQRAKLTG